MRTVEDRLAELGYELPAVMSLRAEYIAAKRSGNWVYVSGQGPYVGEVPTYVGQVGRDVTPTEAQDAARIATLNGLGAAKALLGSLDKITQVVYVRGFVNGAPGFTEQPFVVDGASRLLVQLFGERGRHARASLGAGSLPGDLPVEIEMVFEVDDSPARGTCRSLSQGESIGPMVDGPIATGRATSRTVLTILGSPRRNGNSAALATKVAAGVRARGLTVQEIFLHALDIAPCTACDRCRENTRTDCVIDDRMTALYPALRGATGLIIASPIYWWTMSSQMKRFLDRCYALGGPQGNALRGKRVAVVLTFDGLDEVRSGADNALRTFYDGFTATGAEIVGTLCVRAREAGAVRRDTAAMLRALQLGETLGLHCCR